MVLYSLIVFLTAVSMLKIGIAIYQGKTNFIHDYHQTKVTDKAAYGKAFGKAMFVISAALLLSGIIALLGDAKRNAIIAVAVLLVGLFIRISWMIAVQKKYNKGIF